MKTRWLAAAIFQSEKKMHSVKGFIGSKPLVKKGGEILSKEKIEIDRIVC
ncbi:MAG: hypothetical protein ACUVRK_05150 [Spirochaetota bacterium]